MKNEVIQNETAVEKFRDELRAASFHFAADYGGEWRQGYPRLDNAARIARDEGWTADEVHEIMSDREYLVSPRDIIRKL